MGASSGRDSNSPTPFGEEQPTAPRQKNRPVALRDRFITALARLLTRGFFRSIEVQGSQPPAGPVVLAASHLNGFVDPVLLVARLGFLPRFLAKATLWKNPAAKFALNLARAIPVHRQADGATDANTSMFSDVVSALAQGSMVALFPEGTTHDDPTIRELRTGAARIAIQAAGSGVRGVQIVPVGIVYEDKVALRGRVFVHYGQPKPVPADPALLDENGAPRPNRVAALTETLQAEIQALTPHFTSTEEHLALNAAADMVGRTRTQGEVSMAQIAQRARQLSLLDATRRDELVSVVARYRMMLGFVGIDDVDVVRPINLRILMQRIVVMTIIVVVLSPIALAGMFANLVPFVAILVIGLVPKAPVTKGTVRLLASVVLFPMVWLMLAWADAGTGVVSDLFRSVTAPVDAILGASPGDRSGMLAGLIVFVSVPIMGGIALLVVERANVLARSILRWRTLLDRRGQLPHLRQLRDETVTDIHRALGELA